MNINEFKKKAKTRYVLHIIFISLIIAGTITGAVFSLLFSPLNYTLNLILNIVITVLVAIFTIFYFINIFPLVKHYYSYYKNMSDVSLEHRRRMVFYKEVDSKNISNVPYRVLQFTYSEGEREFNDNIFLLDENASFEEGKSYRLDTYQNVIVGYEVLQHEDIQ